MTRGGCGAKALCRRAPGWHTLLMFPSQPVFVSRVPHASASLISLPSASFYPLASPKPAFVSPVPHFLLAVSRLCPFPFLLLWPLTLRQSLHLLLTHWCWQSLPPQSLPLLLSRWRAEAAATAVLDLFLCRWCLHNVGAFRDVLAWAERWGAGATALTDELPGSPNGPTTPPLLHRFAW